MLSLKDLSATSAYGNPGGFSGTDVAWASTDLNMSVVEKWTDLAALQTHLTAPHMLAYRPKVKHLVANVQLQVLTPVG